jgi:hypothetical protein
MACVSDGTVWHDLQNSTPTIPIFPDAVDSLGQRCGGLLANDFGSKFIDYE